MQQWSRMLEGEVSLDASVNGKRYVELRRYELH